MSTRNPITEAQIDELIRAARPAVRVNLRADWAHEPDAMHPGDWQLSIEATLTDADFKNMCDGGTIAVEIPGFRVAIQMSEGFGR